MGLWLVTGGSGFLGRSVVSELSKTKGRDDRVFALGRRRSHLVGCDQFVEADLTNREVVFSVIRDLSPTMVVHAAGKTPPGQPREFNFNIEGTTNLVDALTSLEKSVRLVVAGSAAEYGSVPAIHLPIRENQPCEPVDDYGASKLESTKRALAAPPPVEPIVARIFNLIGPGIPTSSAFGRFARELSRSDATHLRLETGRLDARRDFIDVRDAARALIILAREAQPGTIYNVGVGVSRSVREGLDLLVKLLGRYVEIVEEQKSQFGSGVADSRADVSRILEQTTWLPKVGFEQSLGDLWASQAEH